MGRTAPHRDSTNIVLGGISLAAIIDGQDLARRMPGLYGDAKPLHMIRGPQEISATLLRSSVGEVASFASSAHLLGIVVGETKHHNQWHDHRQVHSGPLRVGTINIVPAGTTPRSVGTGVGVLHFYLPHAEMRERAARMGRNGGDRELEIISPLFASDPALAALGHCFAEVIHADSPTDRLYRDSLIEALVARVLQRWSNAGALTETNLSGGLAPWQVARVCAAMNEQLNGELTLRALAEIVNLSSGHFSRAFKRTTGLAPFQWLARRRIERGKELLADGRIPLAEVALATGFSAQPAFTSAFRRATGLSPGAWRRLRLS